MKKRHHFWHSKADNNIWVWI